MVTTKRPLKGGRWVWRIEKTFRKGPLIRERKADQMRLLNTSFRRFLCGAHDEIRHRTPVQFGGAFQKRLQIGCDAGFKACGFGHRFKHDKNPQEQNYTAISRTISNGLLP